MISGGSIPDFTGGWALDIWGNQCGHFWRRRSGDEVISKCGLIRTAEWRSKANGTVHARMYGIGDFPRCKKCERATGVEDAQGVRA